MKNLSALLPALFLSVMPIQARTMFVATDGDNQAPGTQDQPYLTINHAVSIVQPGDTIFVRGGTYMLTEGIKIKAAQNAREDARIYLWAYNGEEVIIDGSGIPHTDAKSFKMARCIYHNHEANYWHYKGLTLCNAKDNGMKLEGSYNIVENCRFHDNNDTGLQLGMYKDFTYEETTSLPVGDPKFNPDYRFCRNNVIINCDSWNNDDKIQYNGTADDGGDADGFACKLFPGPGTEFHGCRAWNNSDDNWDLYMVYHPIVIDNCWCYKGGYNGAGTARGNGNGFKLGGGGTSGGAAFSQSVGAHLVRNCVAFDNLGKGFDQNNAYEAMYLFNNVAWGNNFNYRFPTEFKYGTMYMRNNIGFKAVKGNHEFLSANKTGSQLPDTEYNSWTTIDGCDPYKDGNKVNGSKVSAQDHSAQFASLAVDLFFAPRNADGSLPENDFARLVAGSIFVDAGEIIENCPLPAHIPASQQPVDYASLPDLTILYNDASADMGAFETGIPTVATLSLIQGADNQTVYVGTAITPIVYKWGNAATDVTVVLPEGITAEKNAALRTVTLAGVPVASGTYSVSTVGGENTVTLGGTITVSDVAPATLVCTSGNLVQTIHMDSAIEPVVLVYGGGATDVTVEGLPDGIEAMKDAVTRTVTLSGVPTEDGAYTVSTVGGMTPVSLRGSVTRVVPTKVLTGDWYPIQDAYDALPADLKNVVSLNSGTAYTSVWDPAYVETSGSAPSGCTVGAASIERGGSLQWTLPSLAELKANVHFTGGRSLCIEWEQDGVTHTWDSPSMKKTTLLAYDLLAAAGIEPTQKPITVRFVNKTSNTGGIRVYDFFVKVYDIQSSGVDALETNAPLKYYVADNYLLVYGEVAALRVFSQTGVLVAHSTHSQMVETGDLPRGIYIAQVVCADGTSRTVKFVKR